MNTRFDYLYRDADNYKVSNYVIVKGALTEEQKKDIYNSFDQGEYFIPRQIGLPEKRFDSITDADHCWFEVWEDAFSETTENPTIEITAEELSRRFKEVSGWVDVAYAVIGEEVEYA